MDGAGSIDGERSGTCRARLNIKNIASNTSPPITTATAVIINPIPIAVISIISNSVLSSATRGRQLPNIVAILISVVDADPSQLGLQLLPIGAHR